MEEIQQQRKEVLKIISESKNENFFDITNIRNYISAKKINLKELNSKDFDVLISTLNIFEKYNIEENHYSCSFIDYIIEQCKYENLNYTIYNGNNYEVPLFLAISKKLFRISDLLIEKGADINYQTNNSENQKVNVILYIKHLKDNITHDMFIQEIRQNKLIINNSIFNYIFNKGFNIEDNITKLVYDLLSFYNYDKLENIFKNYVFKNSFILSILSLYKNKTPISSKELKSIISKEKTKLKFDSSIYTEAKKFKCIPISTLMDYDGDSDNIIFDKIVKNNILEQAIDDNNNIVIEKIVNLQSFDIKKIDLKKLLEAQYNSYNDINSIKFFLEILKRKQPNLDLKILMKDIILKASKNFSSHINKDIIILYMNILLDFLIESLTRNSKSLNSNFYSNSLLAILNLSIKLNCFELIKKVFENDLLKNKFDINSKDENDNYLIVTAFETYIKNEENFNDISLEFLSGKFVMNVPFIFEYLLNKNADIKKQSDLSIFFKALQKKLYYIIKCILNQELFIKNIKFTDINSSFDPKKAIPSSVFKKLTSQAGINYQNIINIDIYSNKTFLKLLDQYIEEHIIKDDDITNYNIILDAICKNDLNIVKSKIEYFKNNHINLDIIDFINNGFSLLTLSYILDKKEIFNFLFNNCNINKADGFNNNLLNYSIIKEDIETVNRLLNHGFKLNNKKFKDMIKLSTIVGNKEILISILNHSLDIIKNNGDNNDKFDGYDNYYNNILNEEDDDDNIQINEMLNKLQFYVISSRQFSIENKIDILKYLFDLGTNINYTLTEINDDVLNISCLNYAVEIKKFQEDNLPLIKFLIENGINIEQTYGNKGTFLIESIFDKNLLLVKYLIEKGFDVNYIEERYSPLSTAIEMESVPIARLLVENGADVNFCISDRNGNPMSLLMSCIEMEQVELAKILMKYHAKIIYEDQNDYYSLIKMLENNDLKLAEYIKQNNIEIEVPERIKDIISLGRLDLLKILNKYKFLNVNKKDDHGNTPLFYAVKYSKDKIIKFLIECGSDYNIVNNFGESIESINKKYNYIYNRSTYNKFKRIKIEK